MMVKVLVFGSFDLLHEGHKHFFNEAKKLGNTLYVVVAKDSSIKSFKGHESNFNEDERVEHIKKLGLVDDVRLGYEGDKWKIIECIEQSK